MLSPTVLSVNELYVVSSLYINSAWETASGCKLITGNFLVKKKKNISLQLIKKILIYLLRTKAFFWSIICYVHHPHTQRLNRYQVVMTSLLILEYNFVTCESFSLFCSWSEQKSTDYIILPKCTKLFAYAFPIKEIFSEPNFYMPQMLFLKIEYFMHNAFYTEYIKIIH